MPSIFSIIKFLELIEPHIKAGLVTLEKAQVKFYRFEK